VSGDERGRFKVVRNGRRQMSIWPDGRPNAAGWEDAGFAGPKADCLAYIELEWQDLRPADVISQIDGT
jgi:MbtH protein